MPSPYSITAVLEEVTKHPDAKWMRMYDSSLVITWRGRTFRLAAQIHEDTGVALLHIHEDEKETGQD